MKERVVQKEKVSRTIQASGRNQKVGFVDNRTNTLKQPKFINAFNSKGKVNQFLNIRGQRSNTEGNRAAIIERVKNIYTGADNAAAAVCANNIDKGDFFESAAFNFTMDLVNRPYVGWSAGSSRHCTGVNGGKTVTAFFTGTTGINIHAVGIHRGVGNTQYEIKGTAVGPFEGHIGKIIAFKPQRKRATR